MLTPSMYVKSYIYIEKTIRIRVHISNSKESGDGSVIAVLGILQSRSVVQHVVE